MVLSSYLQAPTQEEEVAEHCGVEERALLSGPQAAAKPREGDLQLLQLPSVRAGRQVC